MPDERDWFEDVVRRTLGRPAGRSTLRASDAEREAVGKSLRDAHAEGRLTSEELDERMTRCYRATTLGQLDRLVYDLPPPPRPTALRRRRPWFLLPLLAVLLVVAIASHEHGATLALLALAVVLWIVGGRRRFVR